MASSAGVLATEAPQPARPRASSPSATLVALEGTARLPKRQRESESTSPSAQAAQHLNPLASPTKSARLALATTAKSPPPLTGAAALDDERRRRHEDSVPTPPVPTSPNPSHRALESLMSAATQAMSRPVDAPQVAPTANMDPAVKAVAALSIPPSVAPHPDERGESSPQSASSLAAMPVTGSPTPMEVDGGRVEQLSAPQVAGQDERPQPGSLSYPGSLQTSAAMSEQSARGMSFPVPTQIHGSPTSTGGKKHKCPYCYTEFTRHHNLKSHLLTHSQEKPYVCTECQMRFRRLHDLKRHGKLHTGEKPHVCPKCDRKFARGDALARHSKGAGGCAGRRASMGSFADGEELDGAMGEGDESAMSGIAYDNGDDEELRRQSLPSLGAPHASGAQGETFGAHSRTYPPAGPRPAAGGLSPPNFNAAQTGSANNGSTSVSNSMASSHAAANTSTSSVPAAAAGTTSIYSQSGMTESPKPLSPGAPAHDTPNAARQRSPSLSQQLQQQQMGRRQPELQSPRGGQPRPKLPGLSHPGFAASGSTGFTHRRAPSGPSGDSGNMFAQSDPSVWAYVQGLEYKVKALTEKVIDLDEEVTGLKRQLETRDGAATS